MPFITVMLLFLPSDWNHLKIPLENMYLEKHKSRTCMCSVAQSCPTLCDPMVSSPSGSSVPGISQARVLERVALSFSRGSSRPRDWICVSCVGRPILYHCATWKAPRCQNSLWMMTLFMARSLWFTKVCSPVLRWAGLPLGAAHGASLLLASPGLPSGGWGCSQGWRGVASAALYPDCSEPSQRGALSGP